MPAILYITTQADGANHSSISAVFGKYLRLLVPVTRVFVTPKVELTVCRHDDLTVPATYKHAIFGEIGKYVDFSEIDFVIIRNHYRFISQALRLRRSGQFRFLVGFQQSYPFAFHKYFVSRGRGSSYLTQLLKYVDYKRKQWRNRMLLSRADFFLPISTGLHERFHSYFTGKVHVLGMGIDPQLIEALPSAARIDADNGAAPCRFIYIGGIDKVRESATMLRAFSQLEGDWILDIYTPHVTHARHLVETFHINDARIAIHDAIPREALFGKMTAADVGINLMPDNPVWQTASPTKLMEYYACGLPCVMTPITECRKLFEGTGAGWFCEFRVEDIVATLQEVMRTPRSTLQSKGDIGRQIILEKRNYQRMSADLYGFLCSLYSASRVSPLPAKEDSSVNGATNLR